MLAGGVRANLFSEANVGATSCMNFLVDVKPLPILWQADAKSADFRVWQMSAELSVFVFFFFKVFLSHRSQRRTSLSCQQH